MTSTDFIKAGRLLLLVGLIGMVLGVSELKLATCLIIAALFYATAGIIQSIEQARAGAQPEKREA